MRKNRNLHSTKPDGGSSGVSALSKDGAKSVCLSAYRKKPEKPAEFTEKALSALLNDVLTKKEQERAVARHIRALAEKREEEKLKKEKVKKEKNFAPDAAPAGKNQA